MKLVPYLVPIELSKVNKFASGLPTDFGPTIKLATTLKTTIWAARNVGTQIRQKRLEKAEAGEKRKLEESSRYEKKRTFSKSDPNEKRSGSVGEVEWCNKCKKKHVGQFKREMTCYRYRRPGHYSDECRYEGRVCNEC